jgi:hypothetical protein
MLGRGEMMKALAADHLNRGVKVTVCDSSEIYKVLDRIWFTAGNVDGCLCIGCLEIRLGRRL